MEDLLYEGKLVYLTIYYDKWLREVNSDFNVPMANRMARVIKVFDWESDEGKLLLQAREKTKKWGKFNPKNFKFVLKIYCPELILGDKLGFTVEEVAPLKYPSTELKMFDIVPDWMLGDIKEDIWESFSVEAKGSKNSIKSSSKEKTSKKPPTKRRARK